MTNQRIDTRGAPRVRPKKWDGSRYAPKRKVCAFCAEKTAIIDYKDGVKLRHFISDRGKIEPRRRTGTCARHQRELATAIKRAKILALLPFVAAHVRETGVAAVATATTTATATVAATAAAVEQPPRP